MLSRDQILKADDIKEKMVFVPEWGGEVRIKMMSGTERDNFEASIYNSDEKTTDLTNIRAKLCVAVMVDEKGKRLFSLEDVIALGAKSAKALDRVYDEATSLNKITAADQEELVKNSGKGKV